MRYPAGGESVATPVRHRAERLICFFHIFSLAGEPQPQQSGCGSLAL